MTPAILGSPDVVEPPYSMTVAELVVFLTEHGDPQDEVYVSAGQTDYACLILARRDGRDTTVLEIG